MSTKYIVRNIFVIFLSLMDSEVSNSIDLKKFFSLVSGTNGAKVCCRQREARVMQNNRSKVKMRD